VAVGGIGVTVEVLVGSGVGVPVAVARGLVGVIVGRAEVEDGSGVPEAVALAVGGIGKAESFPAAGVLLTGGLVGGTVAVAVAAAREGVLGARIPTVAVARMTWTTGAAVGAAPNRSQSTMAARATSRAPRKIWRIRGRPTCPPPPSPFRPGLTSCTGFTDDSLSILHYGPAYIGYCGIFVPFAASG